MPNSSRGDEEKWDFGDGPEDPSVAADKDR